MVLDAKSGGAHSDYGSIGLGGGGGGSEVSTSNPQVTMTHNDLYQRQPLLPQESSWPIKNGSSHSIPLATTDFYQEEEEDVDKVEGTSIKRNVSANGMVRIDMPGPLREESSRFPEEKWKTFVGFLVLVVSFITTTVSLALVHERVPDKNKYPPLPDIFLDNVPTFPWMLDVSEIIIMFSTSITFVVIFLQKHRYIIFRRVFLILSLLYMMRSVTMYVTVLPLSNSTYYCSPKANSTSAFLVAKRVFQLLSGFGLSIYGKHTFCGDFIYSGHTVILVMCYLIINEYVPKRLFLLCWGSWLASFVGILLVLMARGHYTVDVLIAYYVTTRLFWIYHTLANHQHLKRSTGGNHLSRLWWFRFFLYFEGNVGGQVPILFNWPFPWPRRLVKHPNRDS